MSYLWFRDKTITREEFNAYQARVDERFAAAGDEIAALARTLAQHNDSASTAPSHENAYREQWRSLGQRFDALERTFAQQSEHMEHTLSSCEGLCEIRHKKAEREITRLQDILTKFMLTVGWRAEYKEEQIIPAHHEIVKIAREK